MRLRGPLTSLVIACFASSAVAASKNVVYPVQMGAETVRYDQAVPTVDLWTDRGGVQITPMQMDHGSFSFALAVFNGADQAANFGTENISVETDGQPLRIYSKQELVSKAKNRAFWTTFGLAVLGGLAAAGAGSQRTTYRSTTYTRYGAYRTYYRAPSLAGQLQADRISRDTAWAIAANRYQLDETKARLQNELVQLSTVDPGDSYGGRIIIQKFDAKLPQKLKVTINWNGDQYPFTFLLAKPGTPAPQFTAITNAQTASRMNAAAPGPMAQRAVAGAPSIPTQKIAMARPAAAPAGAVRLVRGAWKVPARTHSGFCIAAPDSYIGTGSTSAPAITTGMPRCTPDIIIES